MIDIIIPAYNAHNTLGRALLSIVNQINRGNVVVYIIDDGSETDYKDLVSCYSNLINIKLIRIKNSGPGKARQVGLDSSNNEYIVFLDSDGYFYNEYSLLNLVNSIQNADLVQGKYLEVTKDETKEKEPQAFYFHGKMFRRSIINKNKIQFEHSMIKKGDIYEDSTFNQIYALCCDRISTINDFIYVYDYNENSLTRNNKDNALNLKNFIKAMNWLIKEVEKRKIDKKHDLSWYYCISMFHCYFNYLLCPNECQFVFDDMKELKRVYNNYIEYLDFNEKLDVYKLFNYPVIPNITIDEFISMIK